jgi:hypothetical protein
MKISMSSITIVHQTDSDLVFFNLSALSPAPRTLLSLEAICSLHLGVSPSGSPTISLRGTSLSLSLSHGQASSAGSWSMREKLKKGQRFKKEDRKTAGSGAHDRQEPDSPRTALLQQLPLQRRNMSEIGLESLRRSVLINNRSNHPPTWAAFMTFHITAWPSRTAPLCHLQNVHHLFQSSAT